MAISDTADVSRNTLQWGRAHVSAEIWQIKSQTALVAEQLQWGRAHVSAEMPALFTLRTRFLSFNGAALT